jgi:hypothetical protein
LGKNQRVGVLDLAKRHDSLPLDLSTDGHLSSLGIDRDVKVGRVER